MEGGDPGLEWKALRRRISTWRVWWWMSSRGLAERLRSWRETTKRVKLEHRAHNLLEWKLGEGEKVCRMTLTQAQTLTQIKLGASS